VFELKVARETFKRIGCFSQVHPGTSLRVIGLFPLAIDLSNRYMWTNMSDPWNLVTCRNKIDRMA
jgi:hypothetical protein